MKQILLSSGVSFAMVKVVSCGHPLLEKLSNFGAFSGMVNEAISHSSNVTIYNSGAY